MKLTIDYILSAQSRVFSICFFFPFSHYICNSCKFHTPHGVHAHATNIWNNFDIKNRTNICSTLVLKQAPVNHFFCKMLHFPTESIRSKDACTVQKDCCKISTTIFTSICVCNENYTIQFPYFKKNNALPSWNKHFGKGLDVAKNAKNAAL